ncbi:M23 family metallopeptidase, partial [Leucothrix pacifica]
MSWGHWFKKQIITIYKTLMAFRTHKPFINLISKVVLLFTLLGSVVLAKYSPIEELREDGFYGRIHAWGGISRKFHKTEVKVPANAPVIISDYLSTVGSNGLGRGGKHRGIDIFEEIGSPIIAAADGRVIRAKVDKCWGPTMLIRHGRDKNGRRLYALYGHMKNFAVKVGDKVKRGQKIAEMGNDIYTSCGAGFHHLHFQLSYNPRKVPILGWGWANFVMDGFNSPNPHDYWEDGKGRITCFEEGKKYSASGLTYPVPCKNKPHKKENNEAMIAEKAPDDDVMLTLEEVYSSLLMEEAAEAQAA